ncbi:MAG: serine--glyoxylate aminotransferase [Sulfobacillus acidophilus]|uniref:Serine--glyoxylate aminotransferase n=1 Tax=Sulfobacillus acidophilus TaxID=53633 RepID=A0A2T2WFQ1_9FIRM|nr:MAG: serine--glyoxylate aminotransferase [Sulfobacillus acidophilus]
MHILLPGPTPVPKAVEQAMLTAMSDHRGSLFATVQKRVLQQLADLFQAPSANHVAVLPASGTGGLEAAIQNLFMPGDDVLVVETGLFGRRFGEVAQSLELKIDRLEIPWGQAFKPQDILARVADHPYRGILVTHNETSTGVLNPVEELSTQLLTVPERPLLVVDSISGVPSIPLRLSGAIDAIVAASQKGFMCPPGLAILAFSDGGREAILANRPGRFYFDLNPYLKGHLPYTPAVSLWYGLDAALDLLAQEGEKARFARHRLLRDMVRAYGAAGGLSLLVEESHASPTVTALGLPASLKPGDVRRHAEERGLQIAGALGPWHDSAIRIGHVGAIDVGDLWAGLGLLAPELLYPEDALKAAYQVATQKLIAGGHPS